MERFGTPGGGEGTDQDEAAATLVGVSGDPEVRNGRVAVDDLQAERAGGHADAEPGPGARVDEGVGDQLAGHELRVAHQLLPAPHAAVLGEEAAGAGHVAWIGTDFDAGALVERQLEADQEIDEVGDVWCFVR